jgi:hypothetical protein
MKQIETLINKYLDGLTSNDEERQLRKYFAHAGNDIPKEWKALKALFAFEMKESEEAQSSEGAKIISIRHRNRRISWIITAAACVAITLVFTFGRVASPKNYAVVDGKKYTDKEMVERQAMEALDNVSSDDNEIFSALSEQ